MFSGKEKKNARAGNHPPFLSLRTKEEFWSVPINGQSHWHFHLADQRTFRNKKYDAFLDQSRKRGRVEIAMYHRLDILRPQSDIRVSTSTAATNGHSILISAPYSLEIVSTSKTLTIVYQFRVHISHERITYHKNPPPTLQGSSG